MLKYFAVLLLVSLSFAHIEGEAKVVGDYRVELSALEEEIRSGVNTDIVVAVENLTGSRVAGKRIWVAVSTGDKLLLSLPDIVTDASGAAKINYVFPGPGTYAADVTVDGSKADFELNVAGDVIPFYATASAAVFLAVGLIAGVWYGRRKIR